MNNSPLALFAPLTAPPLPASPVLVMLPEPNGSLNSSGGSQMGTMPAGAPATGGGSTAGTQDKGLLTAGGAALLAAGGIAAHATRQHTTANQDQAS